MNYEKISEAVDGVKQAMSGAADSMGGSNEETGGMMEKAKGLLPDMSNLYLQPLNPGSDMSLPDRASLVMQSARPWGEFLDLRNFNLPPLEQVRVRVGHNVETYFYNYFLLACLHMFIFAFAHFGSVVALTCWLGLAYYMYIAHPEDIDVGGKITLTDKLKKIVLVITGLLALTIGHVFTLVISLAVFVLIVVGIHSIIRDDTADSADVLGV